MNENLKTILILLAIALGCFLAVYYVFVPLFSLVADIFILAFSLVADIFSTAWEAVKIFVGWLVWLLVLVASAYILNIIYYFFRINTWRDLSDDYDHKLSQIQPEQLINKKNTTVRAFQKKTIINNLPKKLQVNNYEAMLITGINSEEFGPKNPLENRLKLFDISTFLNDIFYKSEMKESIELFSFIHKKNKKIEKNLNAQLISFVPLYAHVFSSYKSISPPPVLLHTFEDSKADIADNLFLVPLQCTLNFQMKALSQLQGSGSRENIEKLYIDYNKLLHSDQKKLDYLSSRMLEFYNSLECFESNEISKDNIENYEALVEEIPKEIANYIHSVFGHYK